MGIAYYRVYRAFRSVYLFFILLLLLLPVSHAGSEPAGAIPGSHAESLVATARELRLYEDRYWDILLHYKTSGSGRESLVDDPAYFLAAGGKNDPAAELSATLRGFFDDAGSGDEHPRCRFPARFAWLKERLQIDEAMLPSVVCGKYEESLSNIKMQSAVLVFPAAHGNGPASMFGHTLIRIGSTFQSELLSYAVNYAAQGENDNSLVYTYKGLFGYYKGYYSILPYYEKVKEYNSIEHRDIWEYELNLTPAEIRRMVMHIWELRATYSDYYFFTENCSYNLLFLLEAARPSLELTNSYRTNVRFWVIPSDTIRGVVKSGVVSRVKYRPSLATRIVALASALPAESQRLTLSLANQRTQLTQLTQLDETSLPPEEKAKILELAAEYLQYRYSRQELKREEYLRRYIAVLKARSELPGASQETAAAAPSVQPDQGHLPGKIDAGGGWRSRGMLHTREWFAEFQWRPAYHDLMDPDQGYVEGAQINFFDLRGRYYPESNSLRLQSFRLLDILSLAPRDRFFLPVSWKVTTGFDRAIMRDGSERLIYRISPAGGGAWKRAHFGTAYLMVESDVQLTNVYEDRFAFGLGPVAGFFFSATDRWKVNLSGQAQYYPLGELHRTFRGSIRQNYLLTPNSSIELSLMSEQTFRRDLTEVRAGWNLYF